MSKQLEYKNSYCRKGTLSFLLAILLISNASISPALARLHKSKTSPQAPKHHSSKNNKPVGVDAISPHKRRHRKLAHKKISPEEIAAAKEAKAREAEENRFNQGRNSTISRAYQLYDSGTGESLLGNCKYSVLQLKLANELLSERSEQNSALGIAVLTALASSAKAAGDQQLARSTYEKLLLMNPQDVTIALKLARLQAEVGDFHSAQANVNKVINTDQDNQEALLLSDLISGRSKTNSAK